MATAITAQSARPVRQELWDIPGIPPCERDYEQDDALMRREFKLFAIHVVPRHTPSKPRCCCRHDNITLSPQQRHLMLPSRQHA